MNFTGDAQLMSPAEGSFYLATQYKLQRSAETLRRLTDDGKLEVQRTPSGRRLIPRSALDGLAQAQRAPERAA